jgi:surface antigen
MDAMFHRCSLALLLLALGVTQPALAQINPFRGTSATPLNNDDIAALTDATNRLLDRPQLAKGNSDTWNNPKSGASGTVTAGDTTQYKGLGCRVMIYKVNVPGPQAERTRTLTWCKTKDGWKTI